jgi:hypothetical protein
MLIKINVLRVFVLMGVTPACPAYRQAGGRQGFGDEFL